MEQFQTIAPLMYGNWMPPILPFNQPTQQVPQQIFNDNDVINVGGGTIGGNPSPVTVTNVTSDYTALSTDYFLCVDTATAPITITLPTGILGTVYIIKDCTGDAATNPITIDGTGGQLVDGSSATIDSPYGSIQLIFNGTEWSIV